MRHSLIQLAQTSKNELLVCQRKCCQSALAIALADDNIPKTKKIKSTSSFVDEKLQAFHTNYTLGHCFTCPPSSEYQLFSNSSRVNLTQFSSSWFRGETCITPVVTPKQSRPFTWCARTGYYTNEYLEDSQTTDDDIIEIEEVRKIKVFERPEGQIVIGSAGNDQWLHLLPMDECESATDDDDFDVDESADRKLEIDETPKRTVVKRRTRKTEPKPMIFNNVIRRRTRLNMNKGPQYLRQLATSRFGRTRSVIDFKTI